MTRRGGLCARTRRPAAASAWVPPRPASANCPRAPLTAVVGYLDLVGRQAARLSAMACEERSTLAPTVATLRGRLEEADRGAERLTRLLTLLFDTSAIRADRLELRRAPCDLA